jgi:hypothetical protein
MSDSSIRSRTQSVVGGARVCRTSNSAFPQMYFQVQVSMLSSVINRLIHQRKQRFIHESKHSLYTEDCRLQGLDPLKLHLLFIYAFTYIFSTHRLMILVSQLPFCNCSTKRHMVGFCVHRRAQLWLSLRAGAHSYKNKWSMMVPISSMRDRFMPTGGRFTRKYKENTVSVTYQTVSTSADPILVNARHKLHSPLTHAVFSP